MEIIICVGSSCHLKGSYDIINRLEELIKHHNLQRRVTLKASFCLGHCTEGVAVKIGPEYVNNLTTNNVDEFFRQRILGRLDG